MTRSYAGRRQRQTPHSARVGLARAGVAFGGPIVLLATLAGCSFSSGGGDAPPAKIIVMPSGQAYSCQDGTQAPCPR